MSINHPLQQFLSNYLFSLVLNANACSLVQYGCFSLMSLMVGGLGAIVDPWWGWRSLLPLLVSVLPTLVSHRLHFISGYLTLLLVDRLSYKYKVDFFDTDLCKITHSTPIYFHDFLDSVTWSIMSLANSHIISAIWFNTYNKCNSVSFFYFLFYFFTLEVKTTTNHEKMQVCSLSLLISFSENPLIRFLGMMNWKKKKRKSSTSCTFIMILIKFRQ